MKVVFLYGGGQDSRVWQETTAELRQQTGASSLRVLSLDITGCGEKREVETMDLSFGAKAIKTTIACVVAHSLAVRCLPRKET